MTCVCNFLMFGCTVGLIIGKSIIYIVLVFKVFFMCSKCTCKEAGTWKWIWVTLMKEEDSLLCIQVLQRQNKWKKYETLLIVRNCRRLLCAFPPSGHQTNKKTLTLQQSRRINVVTPVLHQGQAFVSSCYKRTNIFMVQSHTSNDCTRVKLLKNTVVIL